MALTLIENGYADFLKGLLQIMSGKMGAKFQSLTGSTAFWDTDSGGSKEALLDGLPDPMRMGNFEENGAARELCTNG